MIGPNVSIGENCVVDEGVRIKESIILPGCKIESHTCIVNSIIGWDSKIGSWNHIEGVIEKVNFHVLLQLLQLQHHNHLSVAES